MGESTCAAPAATLSAEQWAALLAGVEGLLHQFAIRANVAKRDRADVVQDAYVELLKAVGRFDPSRASWNAFAGGVARRVFASYFRGKFGDRRYPGTERVPPGRLPSADRLPDDGARDVLDELIAREEAELAEAGADDGAEALEAFAELVAEALRGPATDRFTPQAAEVVRLTLDGRSPDEVAVRLGKAPKDVRLILRNVGEALARRLGGADRAAILARFGPGAPPWVLRLLGPGPASAGGGDKG